MTNIPRRKIYETMLEFEDALIDMQIMLYSQSNFEKFNQKFNEFSIKEIKRTYKEVKALLVLFIENKKFDSNEEYEKELNNLIENEVKTLEMLIKNESLFKEFRDLLPNLEKKFRKFEKVNTYDEAKEYYSYLDEFNHIIPKILEISREKIK